MGRFSVRLKQIAIRRLQDEAACLTLCPLRIVPLYCHAGNRDYIEPICVGSKETEREREGTV